LRVVAAISRLRSEGNVTEAGAPDGVVGGIGSLVCETVPIVPCVTAFPVLLPVAVIPGAQTGEICHILLPKSASSFAEIHRRSRFPLSLNSHVAKNTR
jgi:hypothetical protein